MRPLVGLCTVSSASMTMKIDMGSVQVVLNQILKRLQLHKVKQPSTNPNTPCTPKSAV